MNLLCRMKYSCKNSENCGPPLGNKFDLEVGQRSPSRSRHSTTGKVLSQGTLMPSIKALSVIVQKLWPRLKFLWQTDRQRGQTDEWDLMSPRFRSERANWLFNVTINNISVIHVTAHRCAGGLKKKYLDLRSGSQRHRHFAGFFNVPVLAPTRDQPFYTVIPTLSWKRGTINVARCTKPSTL